MSEKRITVTGPAIEVRDLVKAYGKTRALDGIDLTVRRGQVFGFLGPNGAGKTTTIRILATLTPPDGGTARVLGFDVVSERNAIRARVAMTGQFASLDDDLTGYENLIVFGRLRGLSRAASRQRADELLAAFDLTGAAGRLVAGYSGRIVAEGTSAQLKAQVGSGTLQVRLLDGEQRPRAKAVLAGALAGPVQLGVDPLTLSVLLAAPPTRPT
jgi:ABC-type uncharacterized transport system ATPase subunit